MKKIGVVKFYNGKFGIIKSEFDLIDFEKKDISFGQVLKIGDVVEFRVEDKFPNIKIARNIKLTNLSLDVKDK